MRHRLAWLLLLTLAVLAPQPRAVLIVLSLGGLVQVCILDRDRRT